MAAGTIRVKGLRETVAALKKVSRSAPKVITDELKEVAEPVAAAARSKISRYRGAKTATIRPRVKGLGSVFVTQGARKVTGRRSDFGALQMRVGLIPALEENEELVIRGVEDALDRLTASEGF